VNRALGATASGQDSQPSSDKPYIGLAYDARQHSSSSALASARSTLSR
jgi:hypothetical protein